MLEKEREGAKRMFVYTTELRRKGEKGEREGRKEGQKRSLVEEAAAVRVSGEENKLCWAEPGSDGSGSRVVEWPNQI